MEDSTPQFQDSAPVDEPTESNLSLRRKIIIFIGRLLVIAIFVVPIVCYVNRQTTETAVQNKIGEGINAVKIFTTETGIYELSIVDLAEFGEQSAISDRSKLRIFNRGQELPFWLDGIGENQTIRFYGQESNSQYSNENICWLVWGSDMSWGEIG